MITINAESISGHSLRQISLEELIEILKIRQPLATIKSTKTGILIKIQEALTTIINTFRSGTEMFLPGKYVILKTQSEEFPFAFVPENFLAYKHPDHKVYLYIIVKEKQDGTGN